LSVPPASATSKKAVQNELLGMKSTVDSATKGAKATMTGAASSVNSAVSSASGAAKGNSTTAKAGATTTAAKTTATAVKTTAPPPKPVASKKDPLADVSFWEEQFPSAAPAAAPIAAAAVTVPATNGHAGNGAAAVPADALGRARQRRLAAGYNRHVI